MASFIVKLVQSLGNRYSPSVNDAKICVFVLVIVRQNDVTKNLARNCMPLWECFLCTDFFSQQELMKRQLPVICYRTKTGWKFWCEEAFVMQ